MQTHYVLLVTSPAQKIKNRHLSDKARDILLRTMEFDSLVNKKKIVLTCKNLHDGDIEVLAEVLEKSTVVEEMNLMMNQITLSDDTFTDALARNKSLKVLNLYENKIGAEVCATSVCIYGTCASVVPRTPHFLTYIRFPILLACNCAGGKTVGQSTLEQ
jgi:acylphosphatase